MLFPGLVRGDLLVEGVPIRSAGAIGEVHHEKRQAGLTEEHVLQILLTGLEDAVRADLPAARPELVPGDEEVLIFRGRALFHQILELGGEHGEVVEDEIQLQVHAHVPQGGKVLFPGGVPVEAVVLDGEAPVQVRVEEAGQDVEGGEGLLQLRRAQKGGGLLERAAQAVGVGVEHGAEIERMVFHEDRSLDLDFVWACGFGDACRWLVPVFRKLFLL